MSPFNNENNFAKIEREKGEREREEEQKEKKSYSPYTFIASS